VEEYEEIISGAIAQLEQIVNDTTVPRNIRRAASNAIDALENKEHTPGVRASNAIAILDEISNDPNMPIHTRTIIWSVIGELERVVD